MSLVKSRKVIAFFEGQYIKGSKTHVKDPFKNSQFIIKESKMNF